MELTGPRGDPGAHPTCRVHSCRQPDPQEWDESMWELGNCPVTNRLGEVGKLPTRLGFYFSHADSWFFFFFLNIKAMHIPCRKHGKPRIK